MRHGNTQSFLIFLLILFLTAPAGAQDTIISARDAAKIKSIEVGSIHLEMTLQQIAYEMRENNYSNICSMNSCQFSKNAGLENLKIGFSRNVTKEQRPDFIQYHTKSMLNVCKEALSRICLRGLSNDPCKTHDKTTILRVKSVEPDDDGWVYRLNILLDTDIRKCEINAAHSQKQ